LEARTESSGSRGDKRNKKIAGSLPAVFKGARKALDRRDVRARAVVCRQTCKNTRSLPLEHARQVAVMLCWNREKGRARERLKAELKVWRRKAAGREAENRKVTPDWVKAETRLGEGGSDWNLEVQGPET
jgi:hypothetical protein